MQCVCIIFKCSQCHGVVLLNCITEIIKQQFQSVSHFFTSDHHIAFIIYLNIVIAYFHHHLKDIDKQTISLRLLYMKDFNFYVWVGSLIQELYTNGKTHLPYPEKNINFSKIHLNMTTKCFFSLATVSLTEGALELQMKTQQKLK